MEATDESQNHPFVSKRQRGRHRGDDPRHSRWAGNRIDEAQPRRADGGRVPRRSGPYARAPAWWPDWRGVTAVIVASGPSAGDTPIGAGRGRARFIAVNNSWQLAPWADALYATDFAWWERHAGVLDFAGLKLSQDAKVRHRPQWGVRLVEVVRSEDRLLVDFFGTIGWGGNSGFAALNLAVQFGARRVILVGFDMRLDRGVHWHGAHSDGLANPNHQVVTRWRRVIDQAAPTLAALGVVVLNASPISTLQAYPKVDFATAFREGA